MISVIIPAKSLDSEPYLNTLITDIHKILNPIPHEVLVQTEPRLGYAVKCGVKRSKGDVIVVMDSDGSHDPHELPRMLNLLNFTNADVVVGSRYCPGGKTADTKHRRWISSFYRLLIRLFLKISIRDPISGYIMAKKEIFNSYVFPYSYKFMLPLYIHNPHIRIVEHPIIFHSRKAGKSKTTFREGLRTFLLILKLFYQKNKGRLKIFLRIPIFYIFSYFFMYLFCSFNNFLFLLLTGSENPYLTPLLTNPLLGWIAAILMANFVIVRAELRRLRE